MSGGAGFVPGCPAVARFRAVRDNNAASVLCCCSGGQSRSSDRHEQSHMVRDVAVASSTGTSRRSLLLQLASTTIASTLIVSPNAVARANVGGKNRCDALNDPTCGSDGTRLTEELEVFPVPDFPPSSLITSEVFLDINAGGAPLGRLVIGLFGDRAPGSAATFERLCTQLAGPSYAGSQVFQIARDEALYMGRLARGGGVRQERYIDNTGYVRTLNLNAADGDTNSDSDNDWTHDNAGLLSMKRGGGAYEFVITTGSDKKADLDTKNIVVGKVIEGMDIIAKLNRLPVNRPTSYKDAFISAGKLIKDKRATAAEDDINKPLQKVVVRKCGRA